MHYLKILFFSLASCISAQEISKMQSSIGGNSSEECDLGSRSMQVSSRTNQGAGIGYTHGYTTLEGFFSKKHCYHGWAPFLDLRGHIFNNNRYAVNTGIGVRYLSKSISWGINSYYDYRNTNQFHYNQWGLGLEAIGSFWSLNVNGYLPFGDKKSKPFNRGLLGVAENPSFGFFQGNQFFIALPGTQAVAGQREFAFKGVDAKFLVNLWKKRRFSLDAGIGPYYFHGDYRKYAAGGEAALIARIGEYVVLGANGSYDNLFHQRGQLSIGFSIPFGPRNFGKSCKTEQPCSIPSFFNDRVRRGARRSEIIVLDKHKEILASAKAGGTGVAINPSTGQPYVIWFVNNLSSSEGTYESPYSTLQDAFAVAQANDIIYVYTGNGSPYDANVTLLEGQYLLGSANGHTIPTRVGLITLPAQDITAPAIENSMGSTIVTFSNSNTVSGFAFNVLSAGNTVVANGVDSLTFSNNSFSTAVTTGMNHFVLTDATGSLLIENNQFIMDPSDTGSFGIVLTDSGSGSSSLSILSNEFTNHASTPISLSYSGSSSPVLDISMNSFTPPLGTVGLSAINLNTSNATILVDSTFSGNTFSSYTGNVINLNWGGSGSHALSISGNAIASDPTTLGTNGVLLTTSAAGTSSVAVSNNIFTGQTTNGVQCNALSSAALAIAISGNTIVGQAIPGNSGIQIGSADSSSVTGSITNNICSEHLGGNINGFPTTSGTYSLTIANNSLTGPSIIPGGSFPNGIQFFASGSCAMSFSINNNQLVNHASQGINLSGIDTATITSVIDRNTLTVPDSWLNTTGIQISGVNSSAATSTHIITNNTCTGHTVSNIQSFPDGSSILNLTVSNNTLSGPAILPVGATPSGIQISTSNSAEITATIEQNQCFNHINRAVNFFSSGASQISALIDKNSVSIPVNNSATSGISVGGNNTSASPASSYAITNNTCTGSNNGSIQCFISNDLVCSSLVISDNIITSAVAGVSGSSPVGIQVNSTNNSSILSIAVNGNSWRSSDTYDFTGTPQGISLGSNDASSLANVTISNNILDLAFTSYQDSTSPSGISTFSNGSSSISGLEISNNSVDFSTATFTTNSGPSGISVNADGTGSLTDVTVSNNIVSFAPISSTITNLQQNGISIGGSSASIVGTSSSPATINGNTITGVEGNAITILGASSQDSYINVMNNTISLGTVMQNELGVVTVPFATGKLITTIDSNTIEGNNGGFVGIIATNQGAGCQSATISNNTITNVHGNNPALPVPGLGGGIGAAILGTGDLNVFVVNNGVTGNTPQGIFGIHPFVLGGSGTLCLRLTDNHGANGGAPDDYVLYNPGGANPLLFMYQNAGGNAGTIMFNPSSADFTEGTCNSCP